MEFFLRRCNSSELEESFQRIFTLKKVPNIVSGVSQSIDVERLLETRKSKELTEFREWLGRIDTLSDLEIIDQLNDVRAELGVFAQSDAGKGARLLVSTLAGLIPGSGTLIGLGLGSFDTLFLEKMLPYSGVVAFVDKLYPSVFQK